MRLIDADAYLFRCETCRSNSSGGCDTWCEHGESYRPNMAKIPTIDPEELRPKGEWVKAENDVCYWYVCSECGGRPAHQFRYDFFSPYCPHCGAKMEGPE